MKTFSFPENSISGKYLFSENAFTRTKRSLNKREEEEEEEEEEGKGRYTRLMTYERTQVGKWGSTNAPSC